MQTIDVFEADKHKKLLVFYLIFDIGHETKTKFDIWLARSIFYLDK